MLQMILNKRRKDAVCTVTIQRICTFPQGVTAITSHKFPMNSPNGVPTPPLACTNFSLLNMLLRQPLAANLPMQSLIKQWIMHDEVSLSTTSAATSMHVSWWGKHDHKGKRHRIWYTKQFLDLKQKEDHGIVNKNKRSMQIILFCTVALLQHTTKGTACSNLIYCVFQSTFCDYSCKSDAPKWIRAS